MLKRTLERADLGTRGDPYPEAGFEIGSLWVSIVKFTMVCLLGDAPVSGGDGSAGKSSLASGVSVLPGGVVALGGLGTTGDCGLGEYGVKRPPCLSGDKLARNCSVAAASNDAGILSGQGVRC